VYIGRRVPQKAPSGGKRGVSGGNAMGDRRRKCRGSGMLIVGMCAAWRTTTTRKRCSLPSSGSGGVGGFGCVRLVPSPIPESACGRVYRPPAPAHQQQQELRDAWGRFSPPCDCRDELSGLSGRRSQATRPWRHRQLQTAANSMCPEAWPIFRARHDTVTTL
jgi:hypothetical protein